MCPVEVKKKKKKIYYFPFSLIQIYFYSTRDVVCGWSCLQKKHIMLFCIFWHFEEPLNFYWTPFILIIIKMATSLSSVSYCTRREWVLPQWEIPPQGLITTCQIVPAPKNRTGSKWMEQTGLFSPCIFTTRWLYMSEFFLSRKITAPIKLLSAQPIDLTWSHSDLEQQCPLLYCSWNRL